MIRARLLGKLGSRLASKLEPVYPKDHPLIYPQGARYDGVAETILTSYERFSFVPMLAVGGASNNWVVSGNLTESGDPLLANDPHLALQNPSLWYAMHLSCPTFEATGVTMPGGPFIAIGHNRHIAWGATLAMLDVQDLFIEQFHVEKPRQYLRDGEWKEAKVRDIEIEIKGETPYLEEVLVTEHGPVLADLPVEGAKNETAHYKLALQWVGHQPMNIVSGFLALNRASNWQEFRKAVSKWTLPCLNLVYADVEGNIGYQLTGKVPIRKTGGGIVPTPGWDSNNDWQGFVPFDELPSIFNPPEGFIVTANNKIVDDNFPYHLGSDYITGYRADRIRDLLKACPKVSIEDCRRIQADCVTIAGQQFAKLLIKKICREDLTPQAIRALKEFERWSGDALVDSIGETIYQVTFNYLVEELFIDLLGEDARSYLGESHNGLIAEINSFSGRIVPHLLKMIEEDDISLLEESSHPQSWQTMLQRAFEHAAASLSRKFGSDPKRWKWGRLHTAELKHPLGSVKALRPFFNRGPFPVGGDAETPAQTAFLPMPSVKGGFEVNSRATSYRQIIDLGNFDRSMMVYPGGQSGSPFSKHYDDLIKPWQNSQLVPMPFSSIMVEKYSESKVQLLPNRNILRLVVDQQSSEIAEEKVEFKETDIE
ncbi:MAG: penicillin acylase family protein, partial [Blastocatellia bacterium]|nr:penicillin acylase family protein [Blastocatellia bacterium]